MDTEVGTVFIKNLAAFVRTHEKALANALQLKRQPLKTGQSSSTSTSLGAGSPSPLSASADGYHPTSPPSTSNTLAAALSLPSLNFASHSIKPAKLSLTPHHLFYLLSRFEEMNIPIGPMNVRLENLHADSSHSNYVSFLSQSQRSQSKGSDRESIRSVSSVRSVMSGMSSLWSTFGIGSSTAAARTEKSKAALQADLKYLYSSFTKIPCLRLSPDRKARLIEGYEEFPFDTAVPLLAFKNLSALEITDVDFRQFFGWDRLAEQLRSLSVKRASVEDPADLLVGVVLDDMDRRRRRSSKAHSQSSPVLGWAASSPTSQQRDVVRSNSAPGSPKGDDRVGQSNSLQSTIMMRGGSEGSRPRSRAQPGSISPPRPVISRQQSSYGQNKRSTSKVRRSGSGSSNSSLHSNTLGQSGSSPNLLVLNVLPASKWRFLKHLGLADNSLTSLTVSSLAPLANTLYSLDLSSNLFSEIPDSLAMLTSLRALNLSNCMIDSLHSLARNPLPAITALNLRANRLISIAGIERLLSLERLDLRENKLTDPTELARLTGIPDIREIWVVSNPFVKTHGNYRITIFNLFRTSPGYIDDISIDSSGPGYSERRQLVDRVAERASVPVVKPILQPQDIELALSTSQEYAQSRNNGEEPRTKRPSPRTAASEVTVGSNRRRKGPKRRIVELSSSNNFVVTCLPNRNGNIEGIDAQSSTDDAYDMPFHNPISPMVSDRDGVRNRQPQSQPDQSPRALTAVPLPTNQANDKVKTSGTTSDKEIQDWNVSGEAYRKRIEALRNEVGSGWLSVLSEEGWDNQKNHAFTNSGEFSPTGTVRPSPTTPRANSSSIISGSRTLG
ncbi:MAG: hypothetical protein M1835_006755 [Candelina submexicana]|nr:MAG: hypothetical protein M1835_006755 [Candelina submexicana]